MNMAAVAGRVSVTTTASVAAQPPKQAECHHQCRVRQPTSQPSQHTTQPTGTHCLAAQQQLALRGCPRRVREPRAAGTPAHVVDALPALLEVAAALVVEVPVLAGDGDDGGHARGHGLLPRGLQALVHVGDGAGWQVRRVRAAVRVVGAPVGDGRLLWEVWEHSGGHLLPAGGEVGE
jgi:hypothetical protein